jgi:hypothetical protein
MRGLPDLTAPSARLGHGLVTLAQGIERSVTLTSLSKGCVQPVWHSCTDSRVPATAGRPG